MPDLGARELEIMLPVLGAMGMQILVTLALSWWGRWVAKRHPQRAWRAMSWMPLAAFVMSALGISGTAFFLFHGFSALASIPPAERSAALADSISSAMTCTACATVPASFLYLASIVAFAVGTVKRPTEPT